MLTSKKIKEFAKNEGADLVGIASVDRFEECPSELHPSTLLPEGKSVVVMGMRILRSLQRPVEEGVSWWPYNIFGYAGLSQFQLNPLAYRVARFIEDEGYVALPTSAHTPWDIKGRAKPGKPAPEVYISLRFAAVAAGLGELGWSKVFLSPQFGPMQRLVAIITDAFLEPDPLFKGKICDKCMLCAKSCPAKAISINEKMSVNIEDKKIEFNNLDLARCGFYHSGLSQETSPFMPLKLECPPSPKKGYDEEGKEKSLYTGPVYESGQGIISGILHNIPMNNYLMMNSFSAAFCCARGCLLSCVRHLEEKGKIEKKLKNRRTI